MDATQTPTPAEVHTRPDLVRGRRRESHLRTRHSRRGPGEGGETGSAGTHPTRRRDFPVEPTSSPVVPVAGKGLGHGRYTGPTPREAAEGTKSTSSAPAPRDLSPDNARVLNRSCGRNEASIMDDIWSGRVCRSGGGRTRPPTGSSRHGNRKSTHLP